MAFEASATASWYLFNVGCDFLFNAINNLHLRRAHYKGILGTLPMYYLTGVPSSLVNRSSLRSTGEEMKVHKEEVTT